MFNLWNWVYGLTGLSVASIIILIALAFVAPAFFNEAIRPWGKLIGEGTAWVVRKFFAGLAGITSNIDSIFATLVLMIFTYLGAVLYTQTPDKGVPESIRVEYKLVKRTPAEKQAYLKKIGKSDTYSWVRSWF